MDLERGTSLCFGDPSGGGSPKSQMKDLDKHFYKEDKQGANRHMEGCSSLLMMREMLVRSKGTTLKPSVLIEGMLARMERKDLCASDESAKSTSHWTTL